jgi:hypothetical protein
MCYDLPDIESMNEILKLKIEGKSLALASLLVLTAGGALLSFVGYGVGVLSALQFGFPAPFEYGGAPGYEGIALFGGVAGAGLFSLMLLFGWLRGRKMLRAALASYLGLWIANAALTHYVVMATGSMVFLLLPLPMVLVGIGVSAALYREGRITN